MTWPQGQANMLAPGGARRRWKHLGQRTSWGEVAGRGEFLGVMLCGNVLWLTMPCGAAGVAMGAAPGLVVAPPDVGLGAEPPVAGG